MEILRLLPLVLLFVIVQPWYVQGSGMHEMGGFWKRAEAERSEASVQERAARGVLTRLLPNHTSSFELRIVSKVSKMKRKASSLPLLLCLCSYGSNIHPYVMSLSLTLN
jgi:hypothetical protein